VTETASIAVEIERGGGLRAYNRHYRRCKAHNAPFLFLEMHRGGKFAAVRLDMFSCDRNMTAETVEAIRALISEAVSEYFRRKARKAVTFSSSKDSAGVSRLHIDLAEKLAEDCRAIVTHPDATVPLRLDAP
jgi:hypothetical protein